MKKYYAVMLDLYGKNCLVVGGGKVAERKAAALLEAGAQVVVVSPDFTPQLKKWIEEGKMSGYKRKYLRQDSEGACLVIAATDDPGVNLAVAEDAKQKGQWVNVTSDSEEGSFILPSSFSRGRLQISVSTMGASPTLAKRIKSQLEEDYGEEYEHVLDFLWELRKAVRQSDRTNEEKSGMLRRAAEIDWLNVYRLEQGEMSLSEWLLKLSR